MRTQRRELLSAGELLSFAMGLCSLALALHAAAFFTRSAPVTITSNDQACAGIVAGIAILLGHAVSIRRFGVCLPKVGGGSLLSLGLCFAYFTALGIIAFHVLSWLGSYAGPAVDDWFRRHYD